MVVVVIYPNNPHPSGYRQLPRADRPLSSAFYHQHSTPKVRSSSSSWARGRQENLYLICIPVQSTILRITFNSFSLTNRQVLESCCKYLRKPLPLQKQVQPVYVSREMDAGVSRNQSHALPPGICGISTSQFVSHFISEKTGLSEYTKMPLAGHVEGYIYLEYNIENHVSSGSPPYIKSIIPSTKQPARTSAS